MVSNSDGGATSVGGATRAADGWRLFAPEYERAALPGGDLAQLLGNGEDDDRLAALDDEIAKTRQVDPIPKRYLTVLVLLRDLLQIGWRVRVGGEQIWVRPHEGDGLPSKLAVRQQLLHGRDDQLRESTVRRFIESLDRPSKAGRSRSIASLIMDGRDLADRLRPIAALPRAHRASALREVCLPYIQVASADGRDEFTGHRLFHVWRYFRYTWTNRHRRPPGRNMAFLIRDAAQPNHPVMAIAAVSSAVLQLSPRDDWAGWTVQGLTRLLDDGTLQDNEILDALRRRVRGDLAAIYTADLGFDGANPPTFDEALQVRLAGIVEEAQAQRRKSLTLDPLERKFTLDASTLHRRALSPLFRAKRAVTARSLLRVHQALAEIVGPLRDALRAPPTRDAVALALRQVKQHFASASVLDLTTCGAVPPYGPLLGGKLACLMMLTPFVREAVRVAYHDEPSVIASQMAGRPIIKSPALALLTTTSLYSERSSQYNRVRLPAGTLPMQAADLSFLEVGRSQGHGATNLSAEAEALLAEVAASRLEYRNVNFVFGEGQSPKLRELREATAALGLGAADILRHDSPRIVYVVPLVASPQRVLLGVDPLPAAAPDGDDGVEAVGEFWRARWLASRLDHCAALDTVAASTRSSLLLSRDYVTEGDSLWLGDAFKR